MKKRSIVICVIITIVVGITAFVVVNRKVVSGNFLAWIDGGFDITVVDDVGHYSCDYGNFELIVNDEDNYLTRPYSVDVEQHKIIDRLYKYTYDYGDFYAISEYGYVYVSKEGPMYINLNDTGQDIKKVEASDIVYLSTFNEFPQRQQEKLTFLDEKIIVKSGAYSIWNR